MQQDGTNRDAIGAVVEIRRGDTVERHEIAAGGGHASGAAGWRHFGLGAQTAAELRVIWPDGRAGDWQSLKAGGFHILHPDRPPTPWQPD